MTSYEWFRWFTFPIMPTHLNKVRADIKRLLKSSSNNRLSILDVGGRKSPYTIKLNANITLLDVPQENETQQQLNLGFTNDILTTLKAKRSNIIDLVIDDMTKTNIPENSYDAVVSVEVIEHVKKDELFVRNIYKVIKPGGWAYLTTPNGDFIKNEGPDKNPDHIRHYTKFQLKELLERYFDEVDVYYAVATGKFRVLGLKSFSIKKPLRFITTPLGNFVNRFQSINVENRPHKTAHLVAVGRKNRN